MARVFRRASLLVLAAVAGCADAVAPPPAGGRLLRVEPVWGRVGVPRDTEVRVIFDGPVDEQAVAAHPPRVFGRWSGVVPGTWSLEGDGLTLRFRSARPVQAGEWVTVDVPAALGGGWAVGFWASSEPGSLSLSPRAALPLRRAGEGRVRAYGAYAGDLDEDGISDLVIPNEDTDDLRILLGDGSGGFGDLRVLPIPGGTVPSTNEGADFDGDGHIDFAVGNSRSDQVSLFRGDGTGALVHMANHTVASGVRGLCVADLDRDGAPDLVTASRDGDGRVAVLLNDGAGGFGPARIFDAGADGETACAVADANEDGRPDVFIGAYRSERIVVLLGDGDGGLTPSGSVPAGGSPWMLAAGDLDGDGHADVVAALAPQGAVSVLRGDGRGGLGSAETVAVGGFPLAVDVGDLDGDGDLDAVASNFATADFTVLRNDGGRLARAGTLPASSAGSCAVLQDFDGDGDLDVIGIDELDDLVLLYENPG